MTILLINKNARISLQDIAEQIREQWIQSEAIKPEEIVKIGICMEDNRWYINLNVLPPIPGKSKVITPFDNGPLIR